MDDKIIKAAKAAGFANQFPTDQMLGMFERFYAIARAEALEDAAKACRPFGKTGAVVAAAIKALKEQNAAIAAGKGDV